MPGEVTLSKDEAYSTPWFYAVHGYGLDDAAQQVHRWFRSRIEERELYCDAYEGLEGLKSERDRAKRLVARFNRTTVDDEALRKELIAELFGKSASNAFLEPPISVAYGYRTTFSGNAYANTGLTLVDDYEINIGKGSIVGAGAVVTKNVPPMCVVAGVPARIIRRITDEDLEWEYREPGTLEYEK